MSPRLFNPILDRRVREVNVRVLERGGRSALSRVFGRWPGSRSVSIF